MRLRLWLQFQVRLQVRLRGQARGPWFEHSAAPLAPRGSLTGAALLGQPYGGSPTGAVLLGRRSLPALVQALLLRAQQAPMHNTTRRDTTRYDTTRHDAHMNMNMNMTWNVGGQGRARPLLTYYGYTHCRLTC